MAILMPKDDNDNVINALGFQANGAQKVTAGASSARIAEPIAEGVELVTLIATGPCRFEIGDASVEADGQRSPFLYPGIYVDLPVARGQTHVAFVAEADPCEAYVMGRR